MATKTAIGSASWIAAEKENVQSMLQQEQDELLYPAQHELEWLNEHMAGIFNQSHLDVANIFKTPGKLKGKTPRTIRKRVVDGRMPLTDVFSSKPHQPLSPQKTKKAGFEVAREIEGTTQPQKSQTDSGYHGSSQIEDTQKTPEIPMRSPLRTMKSPILEMKEPEEEVPVNEGSFHSAKENQTVKLDIQFQEVPEEVAAAVDTVMEEPPIQLPEFDDIGSPSDESTPDRPMVRKKSSMTFASLPAREPLKTSIGARISRTSHVQLQKRDSHATRNAVDKDEYMEDAEADISDGDDDDDEDENIEILGVDTSDLEDQEAKQHSKSSTQRLHDKIHALGRAPSPKALKSIPSVAVIATIHESETHEPVYPKISTIDDEDEWIKPLSGAPVDREAELDDHEDEFDVRAPELIAHEERMSRLSPTPGKPMPGFGHTKSVSTATLASPAKFAMAPPPSPSKPISVSNMPIPSTTPLSSPKKTYDGPLSTSKSKLASIMKTAKGLFSSSASVSAAAKLEAITPRTLNQAVTMMPGMFPDIQRRLEDKPLPASPPKDGKRTRSSTEREREEKRKEKEVRAMQQIEDQLAKVREQEKQKAAQQNAASPRKVGDDQLGYSASVKSTRPVRPTREVSKQRPQPVSIKVGTLSQRIPTATSTTSSIQESLPAEPKRPGLVKKASNASNQSNASTFKSSISSQPTKPKALLAAERKKEQDEKEVQRKLEQKREVERKRALQQEETRRLEQEQRAEVERKERERLAVERAKRQAQQDAIERKRQEAARKAEVQRVARDAGPSRPPSRLGQQMNRPLINHQLPTNPAKPAKRPQEEEQTRPQAPKFGAASQQTDAKRRRTEEEFQEPPPRPTMSGAPIRQSHLGKKPSIFNHPSYAQAPQPHMNQFPQPPNRLPQMSQFANSKIPFAEPSITGPAKTPLSGYHHKVTQSIRSSPAQPQYPNGESIHLPEIPTDSEDEDSEDEGNAFPIPDWATPGHLTEQLIRQEGMDGDAVFGPIAPLKMEEIFAKGNKDRLKRLRDRTSSANWAISGDGLTLEEVRADREQRERMRQDGGWRYGT